MPHNVAPRAELSTIATFPVGYFLENLVLRSDGSFLVTAVNKRELWLVPAQIGVQEVTPVLLYTFKELPSAIVEIKRNVFLVAVGNAYTTHEAYLYRVDLTKHSAEQSVVVDQVATFPQEAKALNGACLISPTRMLVADSFAGCIWSVDLMGDEPTSISVWLKHESMGYFPGMLKPEQPGVNGVRFAASLNQLFYTSTAKKLLMRVKVDPTTREVAGEPELVVAGRMFDDFCIDETRKVLYVTTHRMNTIDLVSMEPAFNSGFTQSIAGDPFDSNLVGPSSGVWGLGANDYGKLAYFLTDGGTASPPEGGPGSARLLKVVLQEFEAPFPGVPKQP